MMWEKGRGFLKKYVTLLTIILVLMSLQIVAGGNYDFRKTKWGMSQQEVTKSEPGQPIDGDSEALVFTDFLDGEHCYVLFRFENNRLIGGMYYFDIWHTNPNDYILDFKKFKGLLTKKYGSPVEDNVHWKDELFKEDDQSYGIAIGMGHLVYGAKWETPTTEITLTLYGENYKINLVAIYSSKTINEDPQLKDKEVLDKL